MVNRRAVRASSISNVARVNCIARSYDGCGNEALRQAEKLQANGRRFYAPGRELEVALDLNSALFTAVAAALFEHVVGLVGFDFHLLFFDHGQVLTTRLAIGFIGRAGNVELDVDQYFRV